ncbi:MAG: VanW family protein [Armatimonadota bacterium]
MKTSDKSSHAHTPRRKRRGKVGVVLLVTLGILLGVLFGAGAAVLPHDDRVAQGVSLLGENLDGMTKEDARSTITRAVARTTERQITLNAGGQTRPAQMADLGVQPNIDAMTNQAYGVGRDGALIVRIEQALQARWTRMSLSAQFVWDEGRAERFFTDFGNSINELPKDATAKWDDAAGKVVIVPERVGAKLDVPASVKLVRDDVLPALQRGESTPAELALPYREKAPRLTAKMLESIDTVLGAFTTAYGTSSGNRASNVEIAADAINGTLLAPGDVFSFNKVVGPRESENGFKIAPVIVDGQLQPGMGGGVCQVSTTLYNAVLLAGLEIVSRSHHSLPSHYVSAGRDATVVYGAIDFRFKNSTDNPILIETVHAKRKLIMRMLGKGPAPVVSIEASNLHSTSGRTRVIKDPSLPEGAKVVKKKGSSGKSVTITRVIGTGPDARREVVSKDKYIGEPTIIRVGTGKNVPAKPETPATPPETTETPEE